MMNQVNSTDEDEKDELMDDKDGVDLDDEED